SNQGKADYQRSLQQAAQIRALAEAEAEKAARVGIAQAIATEEQVRAYGGPQFQVTQQVMARFAQAVETAKVDVVPRIVVGGGGQGGATGGLLEGLLTMLLTERAGAVAASAGGAPETEEMKRQIRDGLMATLRKPAGG